ncbi:coiled-coil domain-containing protein 9-like [Molothrus aeneus]|uniref:coiled-coil domain-containing protein 9-like n=1 Tax=Molothrus aeneus TaxID=84833 RepID=UPI00345B1F00
MNGDPWEPRVSHVTASSQSARGIFSVFPHPHFRCVSPPQARRGGRSRFCAPSSPPPLDPTLWMTGRQRAELERWRRERERIDRERLQRHRDHSGAWRREWDAQKPAGLFSGVPEEPEGGGAPHGPAPPPPTLGEFLPLPHRARRRRGRPRGEGRPYSFHDDRWEPPPGA